MFKWGKKAFCLPVPWTPAQIETLAKGRLNIKLYFQIKLYDILSCIKLNFICRVRFRQIKELRRNRLCMLVVNICRAGTALGPQSRKTQHPFVICAVIKSLSVLNINQCLSYLYSYNSTVHSKIKRLSIFSLMQILCIIHDTHLRKSQ